MDHYYNGLRERESKQAANNTIEKTVDHALKICQSHTIKQWVSELFSQRYCDKMIPQQVT